MPAAGFTKMKKRTKASTKVWPVSVSASLAQKSAQIATTVADRFLEGDLLADNIRNLPSQSTEQIHVGMGGAGLMQGFTGLSVLYSQLRRCQPDEDWNSPAVHFLKIAGEYFDDERITTDLSICSGISGIGYAALQTFRGKSTFKKLIEQIHASILRNIEARLNVINTTGGLAATDYDSLYGVAGIGRYLLFASASDDRLTTPLLEILKSLINRSKLENGFPALYTAKESLTPSEKESYDCPVVNCGLAHGVPGVLTLLALSLSSGIELDGLRESVEFWTNWLSSSTVDDQWGINFPTSVSINGHDKTPSRAAWCYGTPGVANSLWLAGDALGDPLAKNLAVKSMEAVYRRPLSAQGIISPCLCHGTSGLLQVTLRFAERTGLPLFQQASEELLQRIIDEYDAENTYWGFCDVLPEGQKTDLPTILNGASGVILPMLAAAFPVEPIWDQTILLS